MNGYQQEKDVSRRAKFLRGFSKVRMPIELHVGISIDNEKQRGQDLEAFVELVNKNKGFITKVYVMLTGYLHRHYTSLAEARSFDEQYLEETHDIYEKLEVPYTFVYWESIVETEDFRAKRKEIDVIRANDEAFSVKVKNVSLGHKSKGSEEVIEAYLLEEATWFHYKKGMGGGKIYMTYPADRLNSACTHIIDKYDSDVVFLPYTFIGSNNNKKSRRNSPPQEYTQVTPTNSPPNSPPRVPGAAKNNQPTYNFDVSPDELFICCSQASLLMQRFGIHSVEDKSRFFATYIEKTSQVMNSVQQTNTHNEMLITGSENGNSRVQPRNSGNN